MRDRLVEIIAEELGSINCARLIAEDIADRLIAEGVIVLPCKIGDEKFAILPYTDVIVKGKVCTIIYQNEFLIDFAYESEEYNYTAYTQLLPEELFDTYEEAEAKLKGANDEQRKKINDLPRVDVVEVRHGEWKKVSEKYPRYVCTCCNHLYNNKEYKYCPNCGAKMDGERSE